LPVPATGVGAKRNVSGRIEGGTSHAGLLPALLMPLLRYNGVVKLYVCWGTFPVPWPRRSASWRPGAHPCKKAHDELKAAGHSPDVVRAYGFAALPDITRARKEVKRLTGESFVPVLVLDDRQVIRDSKDIVAWARDNPADVAR